VKARGFSAAAQLAAGVLLWNDPKHFESFVVLGLALMYLLLWDISVAVEKAGKP